MAADDLEDLTLAQRIRRARADLAPAEQRVVEVLLDEYPLAGLGSVGQLAGKAGVSAPTVVRLMNKLGFDGFTPFREQLRAEVAGRGFSPLSTYPEEDPAGPGSLAAAEAHYRAGIRTTFAGLDAREVDAVVDALADLDRTVLITGGRFSWPVATILASYLEILRPGVDHLPPEFGRRARALLSVDERTVLVAFDYRRYQPDTMDFVTDVRARGATVVLVTDPYLSPAAQHAHYVLPTAVSGVPPFDAMSYGVMAVELLIGAVSARLGESARARLADFEDQAGGLGSGKQGLNDDEADATR